MTWRLAYILVAVTLAATTAQAAEARDPDSGEARSRIMTEQGVSTGERPPVERAAEARPGEEAGKAAPDGREDAGKSKERPSADHRYLFSMESPGLHGRASRAWGASEGLALVELNGKWGFMSAQGTIAIYPKFDWAGDFHEGLAWVEVEGKSGYIDRRGDFVIGPRFERATGFRGGLAWVKTSGRWGCIDTEGNMVIPAVFTDVALFSEGLAAVRIGGRWGFVSRQGKMIIQPRFDHVWSFNEGLARVELDGTWGYVNTKGKTIWTGGAFHRPTIYVLHGRERIK